MAAAALLAVAGLCLVGSADGAAKGNGEASSVNSVWFTSQTPDSSLSDLSAGASGEELGRSVSLSADGTTALVGAPYLGSGGAAYIFHNTSNGWVTEAVLTSGSVNPELFGWAVSLSSDGTTAIVGAPRAGNSDRGTAYLFRATSEAAWTTTSSPVAVLSDTNGAAQGGLGWSTALSADGATAILGAPSLIDGGSGAPGEADIFRASSEDAWASSSTPTATLTDGGSADDTGTSVALSSDGSTALVGAYRANSGAGAAYIFHASTATSWASTSAPTATLTTPAGSPPGFGASASLSADGTTGLIGACPVSFQCRNSAAYIFHTAAESSWSSTNVPAATLTDSGTNADEGFGSAVVLSSNGSVALLGVPNQTPGGAEVFQATSESSWTSLSSPTAYLSNFAESRDASTDQTGKAVALSSDGSIALVGDPARNSTTGVAYTFGAATGLSISTQPPASTYSGQSFSTAVSVVDPFGARVDTDNATSISLGLTPNSGPAGASLHCTTNPVTVTSGTATFDCSIDKPGSSYSLTAASSNLTSAVSDAFSTADLTLDVTKTGGGTGTVTSAPNGIDCGSTCSADFAYNTSVTLTPTPAAGSVFIGWTGACSGNGACTVETTSNTSATANFARTPTPKPKACVVPDVKSKTLKAAKRAITTRACAVGKINRAFSKTVRTGLVIVQNPRKGAHRAHDAKVNLVVSKGRGS